MAVTVGLDIGTTSVKAVAADDDGTVLARARVPHEIGVPVPGAFEHDVDRAWRAGVLAALGEVAAGLEEPVAGIVVAAMVPSLAAVDERGSGLGPGLLYGDHRGADRPRDPQAAGDPGELLAFLGWLAREHPGASGFWPAQAVANHALTGRGAIDSTTAVTTHPLHDFTAWDAARCEAAGARPDQLPDVVGGTGPIGTVLEGLPAAGAPVGGGTIDALAEQLVAGADAEGDVLVILGTTLITWGVVGTWAEVDGLWTIPHTAPGKVLVGGPSNAGGLFLDRAARWLGADGDAEVAPGDVPVWLPYVRGERTPLHRTDLRASLHGLGLGHGAAHLHRAAREASGFVVRHHLELGAAAGLAPRRIVATGGGTRSRPWLQAIADATGLPIDVVAVPEGAALGAAFLARCTADLERSMTDASRWARTATTIDPDPAWLAPVESRYRTFQRLTARALS